MFTYGLEQFIHLHARERQREIEDIVRKHRLPARPSRLPAHTRDVLEQATWRVRHWLRGFRSSQHRRAT